MRKIFCDKCGWEIQTIGEINSFIRSDIFELDIVIKKNSYPSGAIVNTYIPEYCPACSRLFYDFLTSTKPEKED